MSYRDAESDNDVDGSEEGIPQYDAVTCTGLQPESNTFVFGPNFQLFDDGSCIPVSRQRFVWVDTILQKLQRVYNPIERPVGGGYNIHKVVKGVHHIAGDNVYSGVYLLGESAISN